MDFVLRRKNNAINEFVAVVEFFRPITSALHLEIGVKLSELKEKLDLPAPLNVQYLQFGVGPAGPMAMPESPFGTGYQRFSKTGEVEASLLCDGKSITFSLREYSRWEEIKIAALNTFVELAKVYIKQVPAISSIRLQYLNEFNAKDSGKYSARQLLRADSKIIAGQFYDLEDAWHVHTGWFNQTSPDERELTNVNFDFLPNVTDGKSRFSVLILAGVFNNIPGGKPLEVNATSIEKEMAGRLERSHDNEKKMLRTIFSDSYLEAMEDNTK